MKLREIGSHENAQSMLLAGQCSEPAEPNAVAAEEGKEVSDVLGARVYKHPCTSVRVRDR